MNQILSGILKDSFYLPDVRTRLMLLKQVLEEKFFHGPPPDASRYTPDALAIPEGINKDNAGQIMQTLEKDLQQIEPLIVFVATQMPPAEIAKLGKWIRANFPQVLIFNIKLNPNLISGCALSYKGIYKDFSLLSAMENKKEEIRQTLRSAL